MKTCKYILLLTFFTLLISSDLIVSQTRVEEMKRKGVLFLQSGKFDEALEQFDKYISAKPQAAEGYNLRGLCYEKKKQYKEAVTDFRASVNLEPSQQEFKENLDRVTKAWHQELYIHIDEYKNRINADKNSASNYLEIAKLYKQLEIWDFSEKWFDEYLTKEENAAADDIMIYSEVLAKTGSIIKGEKILEKFVVKYPGDWRLWSRFGYFNFWLGKFKIAETAFTTSLGLQHDYKEAEDGLDLTRNQGYANLYQPRSFERIYPIDKYYKILKDKPNDDETRFSLIEELIKAERFNEAQQQIIYLQPNYQDDERFKQLSQRLSDIKEYSNENKTVGLQELIKENPDDKESVRKMAKDYSDSSHFTEAEDLLNSYLSRVPDDTEMRFLYAQVLTADKKFEIAYPEILKVLDKESEPSEYKLLAGQLGVWLEKDSAETKNFLQSVLNSEPGNMRALIALGRFNFHKSHLDSALAYTNKAKLIEPENPELIKLITDIEIQKQREEQDKLWKRFESGRNLLKEGKFTEAKPYYEEVLARGATPPEVLAEYAGIQMNLKNYKEAIVLYDTLLAKSNNVDFDKERGKAYLFSGDSLKAKIEFERIVKENPDDYEAPVLLADSYAKLQRYDDARKIYKKSLENPPKGIDVEERISDLPPEPGTFRSFMKSFTTDIFSYLTIQPSGFYYSDNQDFDYITGGISGETSLNNVISIGGNYSKGSIGNLYTTIGFTSWKGSAFIKTSERTTLGFSYGNLRIDGYWDQPIIDGFINFEGKEYFKASLNYKMTDGAFLLYSPNLVDNRIKAHSIKFDAALNYEDKLKLYGYYQVVITELSQVFYNNQYQIVKGNVGNFFNIRLGKGFYPTLFVGYEYSYADFKYTVPIYYTPEEFSSHSLWAEWQVASDYEWEVTLGGKVGYVPQFDYVLREGNIKVLYRLFKNLKVELSGQVDDSVRNNTTYKSGSLNLSAFWSF